ncbi:heavy-metal-associated domain-containing protein [Rhodococcus spelaei]|uniref:Heavy-metal-associated domain-containing protein n=1 Tax=Rhodococcus spelaei TaxID=2546320 RepID=A0A541BNT8_9NOCA|nr:heavy-metal-associated domain-containing protein [Rhodococcus spelaei]TQF73994.1 heavy-metal-associated domain-containing protein [Rhodococcus spelaei]
MDIANYTVTGMTCGHCASSVREEVGKIDGVTAVDVDVPTGRLTVTSSAPLTASAVVGAVEEAGYAAAPQQS